MLAAGDPETLKLNHLRLIAALGLKLNHPASLKSAVTGSKEYFGGKMCEISSGKKYGADQDSVRSPSGFRVL